MLLATLGGQVLHRGAHDIHVVDGHEVVLAFIEVDVASREDDEEALPRVREPVLLDALGIQRLLERAGAEKRLLLVHLSNDFGTRALWIQDIANVDEGIEGIRSQVQVEGLKLEVLGHRHLHFRQLVNRLDSLIPNNKRLLLVISLLVDLLLQHHRLQFGLHLQQQVDLKVLYDSHRIWIVSLQHAKPNRSKADPELLIHIFK